MRIACDTQVQMGVVRDLINLGHEVVYVASDQHDEFWFNEAENRGAEVFISPDYDIINMADRRNIAWIQLKQNQSASDTFKIIRKELARIQAAQVP